MPKRTEGNRKNLRTPETERSLQANLSAGTTEVIAATVRADEAKPFWAVRASGLLGDETCVPPPPGNKAPPEAEALSRQKASLSSEPAEDDGDPGAAAVPPARERIEFSSPPEAFGRDDSSEPASLVLAGAPQPGDADEDVSSPSASPGPAFDQDPLLLSANLALCVVEIIAGARALDQVARWVSDSVFTHLTRRTVIAAKARLITGEEPMRPRIQLGKPVISRIGETIVEAVVMIHQPSRSRAVALRLEWYRTRWRATAINVL